MPITTCTAVLLYCSLNSGRSCLKSVHRHKLLVQLSSFVMKMASNRVRDTRSWLARYSTLSEKLFLSGRTLDDQQQSPLFASKDIELQSKQQEYPSNHPSDLLQLYDRTGFICRVVNWGDETECRQQSYDYNDAYGSAARSICKYSFLSDWERLWNFIAEEESDEIAVQLPFLRTCIELVFHPRIVQLSYLLFLWNMVLLVILQAGYSAYMTDGIYESLYLNSLFEFVVYLLVGCMMKGPSTALFFQRPKSKASDSNNVSFPSTFDDKEIAQEAVNQEFPIMSTLRRMVRRGRLEIKTWWTQNTTKGFKLPDESKADTRQNFYYYHWINMALKILTRDYGVDVQKINFNRQSYRFVLLFTFTLYPLYVIIMFYVKDSLLLEEFCQSSGRIPQVCQFYTVCLVASFFGLTFVLQQYLYGASVLLSLVSLAYGGEIAFRLAESWSRKFHSLRRVELEISPVSTVSSSVDEKENNSTEKTESKKQQQQQTGGRHSVSKINFGVHSKAVLDFATLHQPLCMPAESAALATFIARDATEHYLFICALIRRAGTLWSPVFLLYIFLAVYICLTNLLILMEVANTSSTFSSVIWMVALITFVVVRAIVLLFYPLISIAFANSYFIKLTETFRIADSEDYPLIGGRDRWLTIFSESPAAWTFFGFWITPERLAAVLWTSLIALGGVFLSTFISNSRL